VDLVFGRGDLSELKTSIAAQGLLTPLLIARTADGYELLAGHRRLQCIQELGVPNVPCRLVITQEPEGGGGRDCGGEPVPFRTYSITAPSSEDMSSRILGR